MKIAFVTSCLAPGKDGVGDYTRLLAEECQRQGHACACLALNDRFIQPLAGVLPSPNLDPLNRVGAHPGEEIESRSRIKLGTTAGEEERSATLRSKPANAVPTLRLSAATPWPDRLVRARQFLADFAPDWISVQFVGYGFHPKGLELRLPGWLRSLARGARWQLMFHELWIGADTQAGLKARLVGAVQRWNVLRLLRVLAPGVVHTTNPAYQSLLARHGVRARRLPLFGAIPVVPKPDCAWIYEELQRAGVALAPANREAYWVLGFFGTLHPVWPPEPLFHRLREAAERAGKRVVLGALGRTGAGQPLWKAMTRDYARTFQFHHFGEQSPERISAVLQFLDFGIATTPRVILGKSATAAAMLEHGLPLIVNRDDIQFRGHLPAPNGQPALLVNLDTHLPRRLAAVRRQPPQSRLPEVTRSFLYELKSKIR